jgi:hypothetical protein
MRIVWIYGLFVFILPKITLNKMNRTLSVAISEQDFNQLAFTSENVTYEELVKKIKKQLALAALRQVQETAEQAGLSAMTLDEINAEIKAARDAKRRH